YMWGNWILFDGPGDVVADGVDVGLGAEVAGAAGGVGEEELFGVGLGDGEVEFVLAGALPGEDEDDLGFEVDLFGELGEVFVGEIVGGFFFGFQDGGFGGGGGGEGFFVGGGGWDFFGGGDGCCGGGGRGGCGC